MKIGEIREKIILDEYSVSDHAIIEAKKDGIDPNTVEKIEYVVLNGKIIEDYPERKRCLVYAKLPDEDLSVHIVVDFSYPEELAIITAYVPDDRYWINFQIRKKER